MALLVGLLVSHVHLGCQKLSQDQHSPRQGLHCHFGGNIVGDPILSGVLRKARLMRNFVELKRLDCRGSSFALTTSAFFAAFPHSVSAAAW